MSRGPSSSIPAIVTMTPVMPLSLMLVLVAAGALAADATPSRPVLPGSIATLKAAQNSARGQALAASSLDVRRDNQTMTAVLDARRAMLAATNESRTARPTHRGGSEDDAVGQGDGDGGDGDEQQPTATANAASDEDQGDEHRPQNHRVVDPTGEGRFSPSQELGPISDQYGYDGPTRHIHIHQHHVGATAGTPTGAGSSYTAPTGASAGRRPTTSPAQTPGLSHYRASGSSAPSAPSVPSGSGHDHRHVLLSYKPVKFESEEQDHQHHQHHQQQYSVHEDQDHHHYHNQQAVHAAIAAAHPVPHSSGQSVAGEATGELAVGIGLGAGLAEGLEDGGLGSGGLGGGGLGGGGLGSGSFRGGGLGGGVLGGSSLGDGAAGGGLQYPLLGAAPYEPPKALSHEPLAFSHKPKEVKKGKSSNLWKSALRVVAGLAPLALLVAAIQPNVLIIDPRLGNTIRQRSSEGKAAQQGQQGQQRCEQRAVCEVARATGPQTLQTLVNSTPRSRTQADELAAIVKAVEADACSQFLCDQYDVNTHNLTASLMAAATARNALVTPGPPPVATTPMMAAIEDAVVAAPPPGRDTATVTAPSAAPHLVRRTKTRRKKVGVAGAGGGGGGAEPQPEP